MNINQMERIISVAEEGSISEAARKMFISQPSLSQMILAVENEIGMPLFNRRTQPMQLTYAGERYVSMAKQILKYRTALINEFQNIKEGLSGKISIGITLRRSNEILPHILPVFLQKYPRLTFDLTNVDSYELEQMLLQGKIDIAFGNNAPNDKRISTVRLNNEYLMLAASSGSPIAKRLSSKTYTGGQIVNHQISVKEAADEPFILLHPPHKIRKCYNQIIQEAQISPQTLMEVDNTYTALRLVETGIGVTIVPVILPNDMKFEHTNKGVSYFALDSKYAIRDFFLYYDNTAYFTAAHREFIEIAKRKFSVPVSDYAQ